MGWNQAAMDVSSRDRRAGGGQSPHSGFQGCMVYTVDKDTDSWEPVNPVVLPFPVSILESRCFTACSRRLGSLLFPSRKKSS